MSHNNILGKNRECDSSENEEDSPPVPPLESQESYCSSSSIYSQNYGRKRNLDGNDGNKVSEKKRDISYAKGNPRHEKKSKRYGADIGSDKKLRARGMSPAGRVVTPIKQSRVDRVVETNHPTSQSHCHQSRSNLVGGVGTPTKKPHIENDARSARTSPAVEKVESCRKKGDSHQSTRLPEEFLPSNGKVKVRKTAHTVFIDLYGPYDQTQIQQLQKTRRKQNITVGSITYHDSWRRYHQVVFKDGHHYLQFELSPQERQTCRKLKVENAIHGWCRFEHTSTHKLNGERYGKIPEGKSWHRSLFHIYTKPAILISLFDGIGGSRVAINTLPSTDTNEPNEFNVIKSFVSEKNETSMAVVQRYAEDSVDLGIAEDISRLTVQKKIFLDKTVDKFLRLAAWDDEVHVIIIAGPPCQDLSQAGAKGGITRGVIKGTRSQYFFHVPRIIRYVTETFINRKVVYHKVVHYIVENVEMARSNEEIFTEFLGDVKPMKVDFNVGGCCASLMSRRRLYFCSFRKRGGEIGFADFKKRRCAHPAKLQGKSLDDVLSNHTLDGYEFCDRITKKRVEKLGTLTRFEKNVGQEKYFIRKKGDPDAIIKHCPMEVIEDLMGFPHPYHHTKFGVDGDPLEEEDRRKLLGDTFLIYHIKFLLLKLHDSIHNMPCDEKACVKCLPQELAKEALVKIQKHNPTSVGSQQKYSSIIDLLRESKFEELDNAVSGTLYGCWNANG